MGIMDHYIDIGATNQKGSKWEQYGKRATDIINKLNKDLTMAGTEGLIGTAANVITNAKNQVTPGMNKHAEKIASFGIGIKKVAQNAANMDSEVASKFRIDSIGGAKGIFENTVNIPRENNQEIELIALSTMGAVKNNPLDTLKKLLDTQKKSDPVVITDPKYLETMVKEFGFTEEQATLLYEAYDKYQKKNPSKVSEEWNDVKIKQFYANLAALHEEYAADYGYEEYTDTGNLVEDIKSYLKRNIKRNAKPFNITGVTPSHREALNFFNSLGVDAEALKGAIEDQHSTCLSNKKRDFVHECAIYALMAEHSGLKNLGSQTAKEDIDALIGYKGDVYSGKMDIDDIKSDIAAYNIYYRMRDSENGNIWETMTQYNEGVSEGKINGSKEFLARFGNGDPGKGMEELKKDLEQETNGTRMISKDANPKDIEEKKQDFLNHLSKESGVDWK